MMSAARTVFESYGGGVVFMSNTPTARLHDEKCVLRIVSIERYSMGSTVEDVIDRLKARVGLRTEAELARS